MCGFNEKQFSFWDVFETKGTDLRFGVMIRSFRGNIGVIMIKEVFGFKPVLLLSLDVE